MTRTYAEAQLNVTQDETDRARTRLANARTKSERREAADDVEFWSNKAAFFWGVLHLGDGRGFAPEGR